MIQALATKLQVQLTEVGSEKLKRVNFNDVIENPTEEKILALGDVMAAIGNQTALDGVVKTHQTHYKK